MASLYHFKYMAKELQGQSKNSILRAKDNFLGISPGTNVHLLNGGIKKGDDN